MIGREEWERNDNRTNKRHGETTRENEGRE
jgi:hypothetical protein